MNSSTHLLIAQPEYKTIRDLKGKTLAISTFGAFTEAAGKMMMRHGGGDPDKEMKIVPLGVERARYAALKEDIVDVAVLCPPTDSDAQRQGYRVLSRFYEIYKIPFIGLGTYLKKIVEQRDEVKRMTKALLRANLFDARLSAFENLATKHTELEQHPTRGLWILVAPVTARIATEVFSFAITLLIESLVNNRFYAQLNNESLKRKEKSRSTR